MLRNGTLHEFEETALGDGTHRAITMVNAPPHGILVWAGHVSTTCLEKCAEDIEATDYVVRQTISFMAWDHVWNYFAGSVYEKLATRHCENVRRIYFARAD